MECKNNARDKPKPIKGFIKSLHPPLPDNMASYHISQLITTEKINRTKLDFDGNVYFVSIDNTNTIYLIIWFVVIHFYNTSAYQVDNILSVAQGSALDL